MDFLEKNKQSWNNRTEHHLASNFYDVKGFIAGKSSLNDIELNLLGDVKGKSILHLQCHFGQDTLSLCRLGANVTGVDFSDKAIDAANQLAIQTGLPATFICCDIYALPEVLNETYDIVFTSYGTIGWLPDINQWAAVVSKYIKPGGQFIFAEFHPVVWMFDNDFTKIQYRYFNSDPIIETEPGTYADKDAPIKDEIISWNHGMAEVINSLIKQGLTLTELQEFDYTPYPCFATTEEFEPGKFRIPSMENKIPMVYALKAIKK